MAAIYISPLTIPDWRHGDGQFIVRVKAAQNWFSGTSEQVSGAEDNYFVGAATAALGVCTVEGIVIRSTRSVNTLEGVYESAKIYKNKREVHTILEGFTVPESLGETTSWSLIEQANNAPVYRRNFENYFTAAQTTSQFVTKNDLQLILEYVAIDDDGVDAGEIMLDDSGDFMVLI